MLDKLTVDTLIAKTIVVTEDSAGNSLVGIMVRDNIPTIHIDNRDGNQENSGIMLSVFSDKDVLEVGSNSMIRLYGRNGIPAYTLTNLGVVRK